MLSSETKIPGPFVTDGEKKDLFASQLLFHDSNFHSFMSNKLIVSPVMKGS